MSTESSEPDKMENGWLVAIPRWHPARLNTLKAGVHWATAARLKRFDKDVVAISVMGAAVPKADGKRSVELAIVLGPRMRGGDPDSYWKSLLDALVACGALLGDAKEHVELLPVRYERGSQHATLILLRDIHAPVTDRSAYADPSFGRVERRGRKKNARPREE